nr:ANTAR domain-containing protein [Petropleomorpha daqingensis]
MLPDSPPVALVRTARGWSVVCPAGGEPVEGLLEGLTLADVIADELGQQLEPDRTARRSARGPAPTEAEDPRDARIAALERTVAQLEHALAARVSTERAIGVLAEREGCSPREAFEGLRQQARSSGRPVVELAREVLDSLPDAPVAIAPVPDAEPAAAGPAPAPRPRAPLARRAEHPRTRFGAAPGATGEALS